MQPTKMWKDPHCRRIGDFKVRYHPETNTFSFLNMEDPNEDVGCIARGGLDRFHSKYCRVLIGNPNLDPEHIRFISDYGRHRIHFYYLVRPDDANPNDRSGFGCSRNMYLEFGTPIDAVCKDNDLFILVDMHRQEPDQTIHESEFNSNTLEPVQLPDFGRRVLRYRRTKARITVDSWFHKNATLHNQEQLDLISSTPAPDAVCLDYEGNPSEDPWDRFKAKEAEIKLPYVQSDD